MVTTPSPERPAQNELVSAAMLRNLVREARRAIAAWMLEHRRPGESPSGLFDAYLGVTIAAFTRGVLEGSPRAEIRALLRDDARARRAYACTAMFALLVTDYDVPDGLSAALTDAARAALAMLPDDDHG